MDKPPAPITGLDAVVLIVEDFDAQRKFYRDVLGLTEKWVSDEYVFFEVGEQMLAIFKKGHHAEGDKRLGGASHGISHLEFRTAGSAKKSWDERLKAAKAHAYRDNYQDRDQTLFHFNFD